MTGQPGQGRQIGETARYFLDREWTVLVTMSRPREDILPGADRLGISPLSAPAVYVAFPVESVMVGIGQNCRRS